MFQLLLMKCSQVSGATHVLFDWILLCYLANLFLFFSTAANPKRAILFHDKSLSDEDIYDPFLRQGFNSCYSCIFYLSRTYVYPHLLTLSVLSTGTSPSFTILLAKAPSSANSLGCINAAQIVPHCKSSCYLLVHIKCSLLSQLYQFVKKIIHFL